MIALVDNVNRPKLSQDGKQTNIQQIVHELKAQIECAPEVRVLLTGFGVWPAPVLVSDSIA